MTNSLARDAAKTLLLIGAVLAVVIYFARRFPTTKNGIDFPHFYSAAKIVMSGNGRKLYDVETQNKAIALYSGRLGPYFNHPPFEALLYVPVAMLYISQAYFWWCVFNGFLLFMIAMLLKQCAHPYDWRILVPLSLLFVPVLLNILQGQDSLLLLFFFAAAFAAMRADRDFAAGMLLGCGLFKFHLALPAALPFVANSRRGFFGFITVATALVFMSVYISGWGVVTAYPRFLTEINGLPFAGIQIHQMANLRGMFGLALPNDHRVAFIATVLASVSILFLSLREWKLLAKRSAQLKSLAFANAINAAVLVSYHLSPHDLSVMVVSMVLTLHYVLSHGKLSQCRSSTMVTLAILFLPPIHLWFLHVHSYPYVGILVAVLFFLTHWEMNRPPDLPAQVRARNPPPIGVQFYERASRYLILRVSWTATATRTTNGSTNAA